MGLRDYVAAGATVIVFDGAKDYYKSFSNAEYVTYRYGSALVLLSFPPSSLFPASPENGKTTREQAYTHAC